MCEQKNIRLCTCIPELCWATCVVLLSWPSLSRKPFSEFSLDGEVIQRLKKLGFATAFEIQDKTLPLTLEGRLVKIFKVTIFAGKSICGLFQKRKISYFFAL